MKNFNVVIYPMQNGQFLASYLHPLTKRRVRDRFETREQAKLYKEKIENKFKKSNPETWSKLSIEDLLFVFITERPQSNFLMAKMHMRDFTETFGNCSLEEVNSEALKNWLDELKVENNIKDITLRGIKCTLDVFFRFLVEKEVISASPLTMIYFKTPAPSIEARNILSQLQIAELLVALKAWSPGYLYPMIKLIAETAIKPMEVIDLTWTEVNLGAKKIVLPTLAKLQGRSLGISGELVEFFEKRKKTTGPVFMTYYREPFTQYKFQRLINEFKKQSELKFNWNPMDIRHSFAVHFVETKRDLKSLQYILGHENVADTRKLYGEVLSTRAKEEAKSPYEIGS